MEGLGRPIYSFILDPVYPGKFKKIKQDRGKLRMRTNNPMPKGNKRIMKRRKKNKFYCVNVFLRKSCVF